MRRTVERLLLLASLTAWIVLIASPPGAAGDKSAPAGPVSPVFGVPVPEGYRNWPLIAVSHRTDGKDELRAILGNDIAVKAYSAKTLPFPDGAVLAKLAWKREPMKEFEGAWMPGAAPRIEFMVKDSRKYASTGGWGFGRFIGGKPADEAAHGTCFPCHQANVKDHDFVFTRYAP